MNAALNREGRPRRTGPASPTQLVDFPSILGYVAPDEESGPILPGPPDRGSTPNGGRRERLGSSAGPYGNGETQGVPHRRKNARHLQESVRVVGRVQPKNRGQA